MIIYKATNILNNKAYIGKTKKTLSHRISQHKYEAFVRKLHSKFYEAIRLYGWDNFYWEVIDKTNTLKNLKRLELNYIRAFNTIDEGYNTQIR